MFIENILYHLSLETDLYYELFRETNKLLSDFERFGFSPLSMNILC